MNFRPQRVGKLIREELSKILFRELEFPGALVTVTDVEVAGSLETARVRFSAVPSAAAEKVLKKLEESRGELQYLLTKKIDIRPMPHISFEIDRGPERAAAVEKVLLEDNNK